MKKILAILMIGLFLPAYAYAQDIEQSALGDVQDEPVIEEVSEVITIPTETKVDHIFNKVQAASVGEQYVQATSEDEEAGEGAELTPNYIEAFIHSEGPAAIRSYHASVREMMEDVPDWSEADALLLDINEIRMLSQHLEWRSMRPHLSSLDRRTAEHFAMWTKMRVESWLVQAEIMSVMRPDDMDKKHDIESIIAKVQLAQKTNDDLEHDFTIDDRVYDIETGRIQTPEAIAIAEAEKQGFFGRTMKKLKFW